MNTHRSASSLALAVVAGLMAFTGTAAALPAATARGGDPLVGAWRTDGYGMIITVGHRHGYVYQTTAKTCMFVQRADRIGRPAADGVQRFGFGGVTTTLAWAVGHGRGWIHPLGSAGNIGMHRIAKLPALCTRSTPADSATSFMVFWRTFAENYPFFGAQHVNWNATVARYRPQITAHTAPGKIFKILVKMVRPLHNAHIDVISADDKQGFEGLRKGTRPWTAAFCARAERVTDGRLAARLRTWGDGNIAFASLPGHIGYLRIAAFMAYAGEGSTVQADAAVLLRALNAVFTPERTAALRGLIIDVRCNPGGDDALGLQVASRLTGGPYFAYFKRARDLTDPGGFTPPQRIIVRPARAVRYTGPIAMLTSDLTNSAGETFTQAMMNRSPAPVRIGTPTQGVFSDVLNRVLPDGIQFGLPNEEFVTRGGQTFDNRGIPPNIYIPVFTSYQLTHHLDPALDRALRLLSR